jgi:hypothetical protein
VQFSVSAAKEIGDGVAQHQDQRFQPGARVCAPIENSTRVLAVSALRGVSKNMPGSIGVASEPQVRMALLQMPGLSARLAKSYFSKLFNRVTNGKESEAFSETPNNFRGSRL